MSNEGALPAELKPFIHEHNRGAVLIFFKGEWDPMSRCYLSHLAKEKVAAWLHETFACSLIAITAQHAFPSGGAEGESLTQLGHLDFPVVFDTDLTLAHKYGVNITRPFAQAKGFRVAAAQKNPHGVTEFAIVIVDAHGCKRYIYNVPLDDETCYGMQWLPGFSFIKKVMSMRKYGFGDSEASPCPLAGQMLSFTALPEPERSQVEQDAQDSFPGYRARLEAWRAELDMY